MGTYKDDLSSLYNNLRKKGYSAQDIGSEEIFRKKMADEKNRKQLFDYVNARKDFRIGDYYNYERRMKEVYNPQPAQKEPLVYAPAGQEPIEWEGEPVEPFRPTQDAVPSPLSTPPAAPPPAASQGVTRPQASPQGQQPDVQNPPQNVQNLTENVQNQGDSVQNPPTNVQTTQADQPHTPAAAGTVRQLSTSRGGRPELGYMERRFGGASTRDEVAGQEGAAQAFQRQNEQNEGYYQQRNAINQQANEVFKGKVKGLVDELIRQGQDEAKTRISEEAGRRESLLDILGQQKTSGGGAYQLSRDVAKATDAEPIINAVKKYIDKNYGQNNEEGEGTAASQQQLDLRDALMRRVYDYLVERKVPKTDAKYILQKAFSGSTLGMLQGLISGKSLTERQLETEAMGRYNASGLTNAVAEAGGIALDLPVMAATGGIGEAAGNAVMKTAIKKPVENLMKTGITRSVAEGIVMRDMQQGALRYGMRAASEAANFATLEGTGSALQQLYTEGTVDAERLMKDTGRGALLGATMGIFGASMQPLTRKAEETLGKWPGKAVGYTGSLAGRTALMTGSSVLGQWLNDENFNLDNVNWADEAAHAALVNIGFDVLGALKHWKQIGRSSVDFDKIKLNEEDIAQLHRAGFTGKNAQEVVADVLRQGNTTRPDQESAPDSRRLTDHGEPLYQKETDVKELTLGRLMDNPNIDLNVKYKVMYYLTGDLYKLPDPTSTSDVMVTEDGRFKVETYGMSGQTFETRTFDTYDKANKYRTEKQSETKKAQVSELEDLMLRAGVMDNAIRLFEMVGDRYGLTKEQVYEIYLDGKNGKIKADDKSVVRYGEQRASTTRFTVYTMLENILKNIQNVDMPKYRASELRKTVNEGYGKEEGWLEGLLKKPYRTLNEQEKGAVDDYIRAMQRRLTGEDERKSDKESPKADDAAQAEAQPTPEGQSAGMNEAAADAPETAPSRPAQPARGMDRGREIYASGDQREMVTQTYRESEARKRFMQAAGYTQQRALAFANMSPEERQPLLDSMDEETRRRAEDYLEQKEIQAGIERAFTDDNQAQVERSNELAEAIGQNSKNGKVYVTHLGRNSDPEHRFGIVVAGLDENGLPQGKKREVIVVPLKSTPLGDIDFSSYDESNSIPMSLDKNYQPIFYSTNSIQMLLNEAYDKAWKGIHELPFKIGNVYDFMPSDNPKDRTQVRVEGLDDDGNVIIREGNDEPFSISAEEFNQGISRPFQQAVSAEYQEKDAAYQAEVKARQQAEEEAKKRAEEEEKARLQAEEEAKKQAEAEEEARQKAMEAQKKKEKNNPWMKLKTYPEGHPKAGQPDYENSNAKDVAGALRTLGNKSYSEAKGHVMEAQKNVTDQMNRVKELRQQIENTSFDDDESRQEAESFLASEVEKLDKLTAIADFWDEVDQMVTGEKPIKRSPAYEMAKERFADSPAAMEILGNLEPQTGVELAAMLIASGDIKLLPEEFRNQTGYGKTEQRSVFRMVAKKENGGMTIGRAGEFLVQAAKERDLNLFDENDPMAGVNAILEALQEGRTWGQMYRMIENHRIEQADRYYRSEQEQLDQERDEYYQDYKHMSYADYLASIEEDEKNAELYEKFKESEDYSDFLINFVETKDKEDYGSRPDQTGGDRGNPLGHQETERNDAEGIREADTRGDRTPDTRGEEADAAGNPPGSRPGEGAPEGGTPLPGRPGIRATQEGKRTEVKNKDGEPVPADTGTLPVQSQSATGGRGSLAATRNVERLNEAVKEGDDIKIMNEIARYEKNRYRGKVAYSEEAQQLFESYKKAMEEKGYQIVTYMGQKYNEGMHVNVEFTIDESLTPGERIIVGCNKPQIHKNGELIQKATVTVAESPYKDEDEKILEEALRSGSAEAINRAKAKFEADVEAYQQALDIANKRSDEGLNWVDAMWLRKEREGLSNAISEAKKYINILQKQSESLAEKSTLTDADSHATQISDLGGLDEASADNGDSAITNVNQAKAAPSTDVSVNKGTDNSVKNQTNSGNNPVVEAIHQAEQQVAPNPTDAQKEAGNYKKGHVTVDGYDISIENPKGSTRSGVDADGTPWSVTMNNTYGYIRGTKGVDGDHIDVYLSDDPTKGGIYVIDQVNPKTGEFDEHKVMYGFPSANAAREAYLANYSKGWKGLGEITRIDRDRFRQWIDSSKRKTKPFADYSIVSLGNEKISDYEDDELEMFIDDYEEMIADGGVSRYPVDDQAELTDMINEMDRRDREAGRTPYSQRRDEREKRLEENIRMGTQAWTRYLRHGVVPPVMKAYLEAINPEALTKGVSALTSSQLQDLEEVLRRKSNELDEDRWGAASQMQSGLLSGLADGVEKLRSSKRSVSYLNEQNETSLNNRDNPEELYPATLSEADRNHFVSTFEKMFGRGKFDTRKSDFGYRVESVDRSFNAFGNNTMWNRLHELYELMKDTGQATGRTTVNGKLSYANRPYVVYYDKKSGIVYDVVVTDGNLQGKNKRIILSRIRYDEAQPENTTPIEAAQKPARKGTFFKKAPLTEEERKAEAQAYAEQEAQARFEKEKEKFAEANPKINIYAKVLQESKTPAEAIQALRAYIDKLQAEADDWLSRKYKSNNTVVSGMNKASGADRYDTTIGAANERRRANHVRGLQQEMDDTKDFIEHLKKVTGYKEPETAPSIEATNEAKMKELEERLTQNENRQIEIREQLDNAQSDEEIDREALEDELNALQGEQMDMEAEYNGLKAMNEESEAIRRAEEEGQNTVSESSKPYLIRRKDELKAKYPNTLILFREGDYYFAYQDDADAFLKIPGAILSDRMLGGKKEKLAFFPAAKLDSCLPLLIKAGHRVAIEGEQDAKRASVSRSKAAKAKKNEGFTGDLFSQPALQHVVPVKNEEPLKYTSFGGLDTSKGDYAYVERQFTQSGEFLFTGANQIKGADDVAYIFRELENKAIENVFVVMVKDGKPTVLHIGMGGVASSPADLSPLQAAANKIGGVDQVYMVHNHPSGNLINSEADRILLSNIKGMFEDGVVQPGVIIDTTSGKYGIFNIEGEREERVRPTQGEDNALEVLRFDKQVFSPDYDLQGCAQITSSKDVAELVSAQRLGSCGKVNFLVMDHQLRVTANIHTTFSSISDVEALAREIATAVPTFSGSKAVVYGDFPYDSSSAYNLSKAIERYSGKTLRLMDIIKVGGNYSTSKLYASAADEGYINESDTQYGRNRVNDPEEEERQRIADKAKKDGTFMTAPNGKRSRLNERQWAEVRTKAFKDFFGDWELPQKELALVEGDSENTFKSYQEARKWAKENIVRTFNNEETGGKGTIRISNTAVEKFLSESSVNKSDSSDLHKSVLRVLPELIKTSIDVEQHPDYLKVNGERKPLNGINPDMTIHRLYGAMQMGGNVYRVKITLKENNTQEAKKAYNYEATKIELLGGLSGDAVASPRVPSSSISAAKLLKGVEKSYGKGEKILSSSLVLDENGEPRVVYHGTKANFAQFDEGKIGSNMDFGTAGKGFYFTTDRENAENYARNAEGNGQPRVVEAYLNIRNPKTGVKTMELDGSEKAATRFTEKAREKGYDGVEAESSYGVNRLHWFVAFDPKQIRIIPEEKPSVGDKSLVGVHNISEDKLRKALGLGGLANPSAAVIDLNKTGHNKYGEISLVMPSSLVDKKSGGNAGTWAGDAYTPRFPKTTKQFESGGTSRFYKDMKSLHLPDGMDERMYSAFTEYIEAGNSPAPLAYLFLHEKGRTLETIRKGLKYDEALVDTLKKEGLLDKDVYRMSDKERQKLVDIYVDYHYGDWKKEIFKDGQTVFEAMQEMDPEQFTEEGIGKNRLQSFWYDIFRSVRDKGEVDYNRTAEEAYEILKKEGLQDEFNQWLADKEKKYGVREMLFNGYTPSGNKRYLPLTLDNVSKIMKKEGRAGAESLFNDSPGAARARLTKNLNSLAAIRKAKDRLVSSSEMGGVIKEINDKFFELANLFMSDDEYDYRQNARLVDVLTSKDMRTAAKGYGVDLDDDQLKELEDFKKVLQNAPTEYFETKFERPVTLNEFAAAVIPDDLAEDLYGRLKDSGLRLVQYKRGDEADRKRALEEASNEEGIRFSIRPNEPPKKTGIGYKVFVLGKDGKLYPPMVANPGGKDTPVGVWLDADAAPVVGQSKTGRPKVKSGGKGTQGGSGQLAYRPGWHLGEIPYALQFNRRDPQTGERALFPDNFVWAEVEYANDVDYQKEATSYGMNENGKYQHSLAGLPRVPENGSYRYRTNPDPKTDEWIITGAMKVNRILRPSEVDEMVQRAGRKPQPRQEGSVTDEQVDRLNQQFPKSRFIGEKGAESLDYYEEGTLRMDNLRTARQMEDEGKDAKAIKLATGWERGADKKWRYEQPDFKINLYINARDKDWYKRFEKLRKQEQEGTLKKEDEQELDELTDQWMDYQEEILNDKTLRLPDVLDDKALFNAYPRELGLMRVEFVDELGGGIKGGYNAKDNKITIVTSSRDWDKTLVHEIQHAIQAIEGFSKGGSPFGNTPLTEDDRTALKAERDAAVSNLKDLLQQGAETRKALDEVRSQYQAQLNTPFDENSREEWEKKTNQLHEERVRLGRRLMQSVNDVEGARLQIQSINDKLKRGTKELGYKGYHQLAGEVEARNAEARMGLTDEERRQSLSSETEDVAREDQIFLESALSGDQKSVDLQRNDHMDADTEEGIQAITSYFSEFKKVAPHLAEPALITKEEDIERYIPANIPEEQRNKFISQLKDEMRRPEVIAAYFPPTGQVLVFANHGTVREARNAIWHENTHRAYDLIFDDTPKQRALLKKAASQVEKLYPDITHFVDTHYKLDIANEKIAYYVERLVSDLMNKGWLGRISNGLDYTKEYKELGEVVNAIIEYLTREKIYDGQKQRTYQGDGGYARTHTPEFRRRPQAGSGEDVRTDSDRAGILGRESGARRDYTQETRVNLGRAEGVLRPHLKKTHLWLDGKEAAHMLQQSGHDPKVINGLKEAMDYPAAIFTDKGERTVLVMLGENGKRFPVEVSVGQEGDVHLDTNPKEVLDRLGKGAFSLLDSKQMDEFVNAQPLTDAEKKRWNRFLSRYDTHDAADPYAGYGSTLRLSLRKPERREGETLANFYKRVAKYNERLQKAKADRSVERNDEQEDTLDEELSELSEEMMQHPSPRQKEGESDADFAVRQRDYEQWVNERKPQIEQRMRELHEQLQERAATQRSEEMDEFEALHRDERPSPTAPEGTEPDHPDNVNNFSEEEMREMRQDFEEKMNDMKILTTKKQAKRDIRQEIIERRRYIETSNLEDAFFVDELKKVAKSKKVLQAIPDYIEGTYTGEVTPELTEAAKKVSDWFEEVYNLMAQEGVLYDAPHIQNYVTHIWDWKRSPKEAQERYNNYVNTMRMRSPFTKHRVIPSYAEGKAMGMVPKYDDITGIITEYGNYATETIANHRMVEFLKNFKVFVPGGKDNLPMEMDLIVKDSVKDPMYSRMNHTALDGYKVLTSLKPAIAPIFGDQRILDHSQMSELANKLTNGLWITSSLMKKVALSFSFFHHGALTETAIAMLKPWGAGKVIAKNLIWDTLTKGGTPALNDKEATRDAVNHLVSLGATNDYSTADIQNFTTQIRRFMEDKNIPVAKQAAQLLDFLNTGSDKLLWDVIHDGYKIASFKKMAKEIRREAQRKGWTDRQTKDALDEAGQLVNDTFGGLHFDILGYSPKNVRIMRALLLSPDWTLATIRQALSPLGYGRLYDDNGFWKQLVKGTPAEQTRKKYGRQFWLTAGIFFYTLMNGLNAYFRVKDEEEQKQLADEMRKTDKEYRSPYELAYPEGMKWYDYTMPGNTLGQQTHLFTGRYEDGTESYARWGKQFRELPELFFGRDGLSFPGPMIDKMAGKANPLMAATFEFISGHSLSGWENQDMKDKRGWEKDVSRLYMLSKKFIPYSFPTQEDKDFMWLDLVMPSSKGFTPGKATTYFEKAVKSGDFNYVAAVYKACVMNNLDPEKFFNVAKAKIEAEAKSEQMEGIETVQDAMKAFDQTKDMKQRNRLKQFIEKQTGTQDYHAISQAEMVEKAREVLQGEDVKATGDESYLQRARSEDVMEDYRLKKTLAGLKRYHDTYREAQQNDPEAARRLYEQQRMYIDGYQLTSRYRSAINRLKKTLGKNGSDDEAIMKEIRRLRSEWRGQMDELEKKK